MNVPAWASGWLDSDAMSPSGVSVVEERPVGLGGKVLRVLAVGYPVALLAIILALRFIGERWWVTTVALYLPRLGFGLPLPFLVLALAWFGPRRWLGTQVVAAGLLIFPLMGLRLSLTKTVQAGAVPLRVFSFNIHSAYAGIDGIAAQLRQANADIILLQENGDGQAQKLEPRFPEYHFHFSGQFVLASRFPIVDVVDRRAFPFTTTSALLGPGGTAWRYRMAP